MRGVRRSALAARQSGSVCRMDSPPRSSEALKREVSADGGGSLFSIMRGLWPYIWPTDRRDLKLRVAVAMLLLLAAKLATITVPFTFKWATDALTGEGSAPVAPSAWLVWALAAPIVLTIAYGGTRILMAVLTQMRDGIFAQVAMNAVRRLAYRTFEHMHQLSLRFHLERKTGGLTRVLERGRNAIETIVRVVLLQLAPTIVELGLIVAVLLLNYETVKYFSAEGREAQRYDRSMTRYEDASVKAYVSLATLNAGQAVIFTIGLTGAMALCAYGIERGTNTVGDFVMINAMMIQLYTPLNFMGMVYREIKQAIIDIEIMFSLLARNPEITDQPEARPLQVRAGTIRFENDSFAYEPARPILCDLSFDVAAGHTVAIVGPSGAGKSTISRLLFRFYDVTGGRILVDDQDIREVTQTSLRAAIGMVPQDTVLFNDTIRYNIRYGRWDASDTEVEEAARQAQIDGFISRTPKGYETEVGERGLKLSGGEKQRVAIARTILKGPPILLLDEATSALDSHTEKDIQDELERIAENRTTLVIAHRLSTIVNADDILVLDRGAIIERGTHRELIARGGLYASMWNRQREAQLAREILAEVGDDGAAPNRNPPQLPEEPAPPPDLLPAADAAE